MTSKELCEKYIEFFKSKGHKEIPSASLVAENDPSLLFVNSGMFPLVPYLMGQNHPQGKRIVNSQVSFRTEDIEEIGDHRHDTLFEMLGNWSLGDYFKKEHLNWLYEFLIEEIKLDPNRLYQTVFAGSEYAPKDLESIEILKDVFRKYNISAEVGPETLSKGELGSGVEIKFGGNLKIFPYRNKNWWKRGDAIGELGGPDSETFYDTGKTHNPKFGKFCHPNCDCGRFIEIGNSVFMEYIKTEKGWEKKLPQKNVDFGGGLERLVMVANNKTNIFETDLFDYLIKFLEKSSGKKYADNSKSFEIIADHLRAATFLIANGAIPSNKDQGYVVRRLIRRSLVHMRKLDISFEATDDLSQLVINNMGDVYPELEKNKNKILEEAKKEGDKFGRTLERGLKKIDRFKFLVASFSKNIEELRQKLEFIGKNSFIENLSLLDKLDETIAKDYLIYDNFKKLFDFKRNKVDPYKDPLKSLGDQKWDKIENKKEVLIFLKKEINNILERFGIVLNSRLVFDLYQNDGFPIELITEIAKDNGFGIDVKGFQKLFQKHQQLSRTASAGKFKGGLADASEETTRLHTIAHLLLESLRRVLGDHIFQKGSNINAERLRFDFSHSEKLTDEEKQKVEDLVNEQIQKKLPVNCEEMSLEEAKKINAMGVFENKYGEKVKVYTIGKDNDIFSKEICGGPHIKNTSELGKFRIKKEQSSSSGVRRIKAVLE